MGLRQSPLFRNLLAFSDYCWVEKVVMLDGYVREVFHVLDMRHRPRFMLQFENLPLRILSIFKAKLPTSECLFGGAASIQVGEARVGPRDVCLV